MNYVVAENTKRLAAQKKAEREKAIAEGRCPNRARECQCPEHYQEWLDFALRMEQENQE